MRSVREDAFGKSISAADRRSAGAVTPRLRRWFSEALAATARHPAGFVGKNLVHFVRQDGVSEGELQRGHFDFFTIQCWGAGHEARVSGASSGASTAQHGHADQTRVGRGRFSAASLRSTF